MAGLFFIVGVAHTWVYSQAAFLMMRLGLKIKISLVGLIYQKVMLVLWMHGFIFVGSSFRGLNENDLVVGFKIRDNSIFFHNSYRKSLIRGYWNLWIGPSTKTTKIGTPQKLSHPQYLTFCYVNLSNRHIVCYY